MNSNIDKARVEIESLFRQLASFFQNGQLAEAKVISANKKKAFDDAPIRVLEEFIQSVVSQQER